MKRKLAVLLVALIVGGRLFFGINGCEGKVEEAGTQAVAKGETENPDDRIERIRTATIAKYGGPIEWPTFSETEFAEERRLLREYFAESFARDEATSKERIRIQIAKADLNGDGRPDLIWKILHPFYRTVSTSATLGISYFDGAEWIHVIHYEVTWAPIGLRSSATSAWKEIVIGDKLYRWDGKYYRIVKER